MTASSSLTVAKLKALCVLHDLPTSGNKADLVLRLLGAGLDAETLGLEVDPPVDVRTEEITISLEVAASSVADAPTASNEVTQPVPLPIEGRKETFTKPDVMEAEILEAEILDDEDDGTAVTDNRKATHAPPSVVPLPTRGTASPATLKDMASSPKVAIGLVFVLLVAGAGWFWFDQQVEPVTVDALRYGDGMDFLLLDGHLVATDGFVEPVVNQLGIEDDICRLEFDFGGEGRVEVHEGGVLDIPSQGSDTELLGSVTVRGAHGAEWLAVQKSATYDLEDLTVRRHLPSLVPGSSGCSSSSAAATGSANLDLTSWTELSDRAVLRTEADWTLDLEGYVGGTTTTYGVGGLLGAFEVFAPGLSMLMQPVELQDLVGSTPIESNAQGSGLGWDWAVVNAEDFAGQRMWRIVAVQPDLATYCLGSASLTLWVEADNPWASKQEVDVRLSGADLDRSGCSTLSQQLGDAVLPEGEFRLSHTFERLNVERGSERLDLGATYLGRPRPNELGPDEAELTTWTRSKPHVPDLSTMATSTLESAAACLSDVGSEAAGANGALDDRDGYVWRVTSEQGSEVDMWNMSWIGNDDAHGWVLLELGHGDNASCAFVDKGALDLGLSWNRASAPAVLSLGEVEQALSEAERFPELERLFNGNGGFAEGVRRGTLVAVPDDGWSGLLSEFAGDGAGATTYDLVRTWEENGLDCTLSVAVDATSGRLLVTSYIERPA